MITPRSPFGRGLALAHHGGGESNHVERADQVYLHRARERRQIIGTFLAHHATDADDAGTIDDDVYAAELRFGHVERFLNAGFGRDVGADETGILTQFVRQ
jgi:hypothetical protein